MASELSCSVTMSDSNVLSQYRNFVMTQHARHNTLDMGAPCWWSFAVYGCMGCKIEVQGTVNINFNFFQVSFAPSQSCAHGTCHTLDTPLVMVTCSYGELSESAGYT